MKTKPVFSLLVVASLMLSLLGGALPQTQTALAAFNITESFMNSDAPGWTLSGSATLTSGGVDPAGAGWLRLTSATNNQAGSAIYNTAFSSNDGITVTFQYATYGGTGADGLAFYLIDGATVTPTNGAAGGALGYSFWTGVNPGVKNGYVGVGFDEYGNFTHSDFGACNPSCPGRQPNSVALRGSGNLDTGFNYLTRTAQTISTGSRAGAYTVRLVIVDNTITVAVDSGSGFTTLINQYNLATAPGQAAAPATFKMGFGASTGGSNNYHEIRNLTVASIKTNSTTTLTALPNPSQYGGEVTFTAVVSGTRGIPTGNVTFLDGAATMNTATLDTSGQATYITSTLAVGAHAVTAL